MTVHITVLSKCYIPRHERNLCCVWMIQPLLVYDHQLPVALGVVLVI